MPLLQFLHRAAAGANLDPAEAEQAMNIILDGGASTAQIAAFLVALRMKGETSDELLGFARAMRERAHKIKPEIGGEPLLDTCGTGGDGLGTFNISTIVAFVVAGLGVKVAKHGNRSISSKCGSADLLERLGVQVVTDAARTERAIEEIGIAFLFAPAFHPAMKHAQPARLELKMRTVFNLLGPLANPAGATAQLVGAPSEHAAGLMAGALAALGLPRGFVVHGSDGLDEITTAGTTVAFEVRDGRVLPRVLSPADFGVPQARSSDFAGGTPEENCDIALAVLKGERGPRRDIVLVNASAALVAAGKAASFAEGVEMAGESIDSGAALRKAQDLAAFTKKGTA
jgi:anthranilate phosphoribosyltransferase